MNIINYIADLVFPPKCIYCNSLLPPETRPIICRSCKENIPTAVNKCAKCGSDFYFADNRPVCSICRAAGRYFDGCLSSAVYDNEMRNAILEFKFKYRMYMASPLSVFLSDKLVEIGLTGRNIDYVVAVPCDVAHQRQRGFDTAGLLAKELAKRLNIPYKSDFLEKIRKTQPQKDLPLKQRTKNVKGSFRVTRPADVKGKSFLLVDDVITSGATLMELSRILKRSGAKYVFAATLAQTKLR